MDNAEPQIFDGDVEFPTIPQEKIPAADHALARILSGQRAVAKLYAALDAGLRGESHCIAVLLGRDFELRFRGLLDTGEKLLAEIGSSAGSTVGRGSGVGTGESLPAASSIGKIATGLVGRPPERIHQVVSAFVKRALICHQMVPWIAGARGVFDHFRACVEAEDHHIAVLDFFRELVEPQGVAAGG